MSVKDTKIYQILRNIHYAIKDRDTKKENRAIAKKIRPYKNKYQGKVCVVVGNGPSLRIDDLTKLYELGIPTFACNRITMAFPQTPWRPTFYFMSDEKLLKQFDEDVPDVPGDHRFFPKSEKGKIKNGIFYNTLEYYFEKEGKFSLDAAKGVYAGGSVTTEMLQFAYYMGFSEIYLIGVDFSYAINNPLNDKTYAYQGEDNYFIKGYLKPGEVADKPNITANLLAFHAARKETEANGCKIWNATRGGKLEVFDRADLDELFRKWSTDNKGISAYENSSICSGKTEQ